MEINQSIHFLKVTITTLPRTQARSSGFDSDWDFGSAL